MVLFALLTLKEPELAWNLAHALALDSDRTWSELMNVYKKVDPMATLRSTASSAPAAGVRPRRAPTQPGKESIVLSKSSGP
ncbi:hypothetical protein [Ornithinimicrobium tianjinense]|uniref:hypothetical protein n=1 Tax=Ornithinimicrobium tianjinense TaxID=1195761 RepID=UPI001669A996|nr:hypothetical protein [Ornithinimicrobium tianjinense]